MVGTVRRVAPDVVDGGDLGRRVLERRTALGLSAGEVAGRAGMATDYLNWIEQSPTAEPTTGSLVRLSAALGIPKSTLLGGGLDRVPGEARDADRNAVLLDLDARQCVDLLSAGGVGRIVFRHAGVPTAMPVNFRTLQGDIVFRSARDGSISSISPLDSVSFEVDHVDEMWSRGWSVMATGTLTQVEDPATVRRITALCEPWPDGDHPACFELHVTGRTGRRIRHGPLVETL
jgi:transcriptional regulator with XRE-family HTH domain